MISSRLFFLGTPKFETHDQPVEITSIKSVALLAMLATSHEPVTRERVLGMLWAESTQYAARKNLRNALWAIRKALGDDAVLTEGDTLTLGESVWTDAHELVKVADLKNQSAISSLQSAIELYRAQFLDGVTLTDAPEFEIWLTAERERLAQLYLRALGSLVEAYRANTNWRDVITTARRAIEFDNLQEPMYRALMLALAQLDERAQALREYANLRDALERELGVAPLPETETLRNAIIANQLETIQVSSPPTTRTHTLPTPRAPIIGRRAELDALMSEFNIASDGTARVALISGEMGIGKSRLWREWSNDIAQKQNAVVLETRCLDSTQSLTFAPIAQLFRRTDLAQKICAHPSQVAPTWLAEVARLLPEIRTAMPDLPVPAKLSPDEERHRIFEAFAQMLLALNARPLVIFVDDAHWADRATLDWLGFLTHRLRDKPLLFVAAYRPEDATAPLVHLVASWAREGIVRRLPLARLTPDESAALVALLGGDPGFAKRAQIASAGNPYFLIELLRAAPNDIPPALSELVSARLAALPEATRQIVQAAAVLESDLDVPMLRRASGRGEEEIVQAIDDLLSANILTENNSRYEFSHPFVATVVYDGLSGARRSFLHRRAAEAIQAAYAGRLPQVAGQLAQHYTQTNDHAHAAQFAEMAAEHALALAAPEQAIQFYRQAIANTSTPARHIGLGRVLMRNGDLGQARDEFENALREYQNQNDMRGMATTAITMSETFFPSGNFVEGKRWIEKGLTLMQNDDDPVAHMMAHLLLGTGPAGDALPFQEMQAHLYQAIEHAQENRMLDVRARAQFMLGNLRAEHGDLPGANQAYAQAIVSARKAGDDYQEVLAHNNLAYHSLLLSDLAQARTSVNTGLVLAEARVLRLALQYLYSTSGEIALAEKNWGEAEEWFKRGMEVAQAVGNAEQVGVSQMNLALVARGRNDLDSALILLEQARDTASKINSPHLQSRIDLHLAELYWQRGERAAFLDALARAEKRLQNSERGALLEWAQRLRKK